MDIYHGIGIAAMTALGTGILTPDDLLRAGLAYFFLGRILGNHIGNFIHSRYGDPAAFYARNVVRFGVSLAHTRMGNSMIMISKILTDRFFPVSRSPFFALARMRSLVTGLFTSTIILGNMVFNHAQKSAQFFGMTPVEMLALPIANLTSQFFNYSVPTDCWGQWHNNHGIASYELGLNQTCIKV